MEDMCFDVCMEKMRTGDKEGLREIYSEYAGYIWSVVYGIVKNRESAEDVTSDFFIKLWEKSDHYKPGGGHRTYITVMARNMAIDYLRKFRREEATSMEELEGRNGEEQTEQRIVNRVAMEKALEKLDDSERQIINLKIMGDLTFKEIARITKTPMGTVTWKYRNALEKLRRCGYE